MRSIKFGHAFPHPRDAAPDPIGDAGDVLTGAVALGPRRPVETSVVWSAERILGIDPDRRPVYTYIGCLHPELGRVGLIVSPTWFSRDPHGVTRCDTGGLAGRLGGFRHLEESEAAEALQRLTHRPEHPWEDELTAEVRQVFGEPRRYLSGEAPTNCFVDARQKCIDGARHSSENLDRRLWTWEARAFSTITTDDVEAVALAPEAYKELRSRFYAAFPARIHFLVGHPTAAGTHYFEEDQVISMFEGGWA